MATTLSDEDLLMLENIQTAEGWSNACSEIKKRDGGRYPSDWFEKVIKSGLIGRVCARFGETGEVRIVPMPDSFRGGGL